jgi:hypothetical protein
VGLGFHRGASCISWPSPNNHGHEAHDIQFDGVK